MNVVLPLVLVFGGEVVSQTKLVVVNGGVTNTYIVPVVADVNGTSLPCDTGVCTNLIYFPSGYKNWTYVDEESHYISITDAVEISGVVSICNGVFYSSPLKRLCKRGGLAAVTTNIFNITGYIKGGYEIEVYPTRLVVYNDSSEKEEYEAIFYFLFLVLSTIIWASWAHDIMSNIPVLLREWMYPTDVVMIAAGIKIPQLVYKGSVFYTHTLDMVFGHALAHQYCIAYVTFSCILATFVYIGFIMLLVENNKLTLSWIFGNKKRLLPQNELLVGIRLIMDVVCLTAIHLACPSVLGDGPANVFGFILGNVISYIVGRDFKFMYTLNVTPTHAVGAALIGILACVHAGVFMILPLVHDMGSTNITQSLLLAFLSVQQCVCIGINSSVQPKENLKSI